MRTGANPAKAGIPAYKPQKLGIALIVYIPFTEGYFADSLDILHYQIESIHSTTQDFDLLILDNGSCSQVVEKLQAYFDQKRIDWLILSQHNLGKAGAWNWIFATMPNELICYADSDVLFRPGWLKACQDVLDADLKQKADLNDDCYVNLEDLAIMALDWAQCVNPGDPECKWVFE